MRIHKTTALILALLVALSLAMPVFAATGYGPGTIDGGNNSSDDDDDSGSSAASRPDSYRPSTANASSAMNPAPVTAAQVTSAVNSAIQQAGANGQAETTLTNVSTVSASAIQSAFARAALAGVSNMKINLDAKQGNTILSRIQLDAATAASLSGTVDFSVKTQGAEVDRAVNTFERFFNNRIAAVSLGQQGPYGADIKMAVKADLSGLDTSSLVFYVYNRETNSFTSLTTAYTIDANGYLHFSTPVGGDIIISDQPLSK